MTGSRKSGRLAKAGGGACLLSIIILSGCVGMGGNIKGNFTCQAPDGTCAPTAVIDDRAIAMISGDASGVTMPAGPVQQQSTTPSVQIASSRPVRTPISANPGRTQERVLRIVFPAFIDDRGRLHESSAVHAVVSRGEWLTWTDGPNAARNAISAAPQMQQLGVSPAHQDLAQAWDDPNLPDPAAVAAARARKADPVAAIKADVDELLKGVPGPATATAGKSATPPHAETASTSKAAVSGAPVRAANFPATVSENE